MTAYQNNVLIEVEEYFGSLLTDEGKTNKQALILSKKNLVHMVTNVIDLLNKKKN